MLDGKVQGWQITADREERISYTAR